MCEYDLKSSLKMKSSQKKRKCVSGQSCGFLDCVYCEGVDCRSNKYVCEPKVWSIKHAVEREKPFESFSQFSPPLSLSVK